MNEFIILAIPFLGTSLGAAMVFFLKKQIAPKFEKFLLGFAAGVMIAASVWSLLIPSIEMAEKQNTIEWFPALIGFMFGIGFLLLLDTVIPHLHLESDKPEGLKLGASKMTMMLLAVTLHNIPEGMSVGVAFAGAAMEGSGITKAAALALAVGIAIQNFPEGAIISMPLCSEGIGKKRAFFYGDVGSGRACRWIYNYTYCRQNFTDTSVFSFVCRRSNAVCGCRGTHTGGSERRTQ